MIEPVEPFQSGIFHKVDGFPGFSSVDDFGFKQTNDRLSQGVVIRVTRVSHRALDAGLCQPLSVADCQVLAASIAMMDHSHGV